MSEKVRILVSGHVRGKFNVLFDRVNKFIEKNGKVDMLLCVGDFFGESNHELNAYKCGMKKVPTTTYILGPINTNQMKYYMDMNGCEICDGIVYLGKRGVYTSSNGVKIAYVSGTEKSECESITFNDKDVLAVKEICTRGQYKRGVDILLTNQWPHGIDNLVECTETYDGSHLLSWLAAQIKPRYHLTPSDGKFFERQPYRNKSENVDVATRFLAVAAIANPTKQKWLYGLSVTPVEKMTDSELAQRTTDETALPFASNVYEPYPGRTDAIPTSNQFFYDMNAPMDNKRKRGENNRERKKITFDQDKCWFCLGSASVEKHLVVSIGESVYLALAKGGLTPEHLLICPIKHFQSTCDVSDEVVDETEKFKFALTRFFATRGCVPVFFERNYKTSHMQVQVIAVTEKMAANLKDIFEFEAEGHGFRLQALSNAQTIKDVMPSKTPFFCVELPNDVTLYTSITAKSNFPLQFAREVLAGEAILNLPNRVDWQECKLSRDEETTICKEFREKFAAFDFTR